MAIAELSCELTVGKLAELLNKHLAEGNNPDAAVLLAFADKRGTGWNSEHRLATMFGSGLTGRVTLVGQNKIAGPGRTLRHAKAAPQEAEDGR